MFWSWTQNPPEPFSAQSSTGRATTDPIPITAGSPQHPFKQVVFSPSFCWSLDFVNGVYPNPAARPDVLTCRFSEPLHSTNPPPHPHPFPHPFSSKAEICRHSSNGKLSLRPRQVFPTDRIHRGISALEFQTRQDRMANGIAGSVQNGVQWDQISIRVSDLCIRPAVGFKNVFIHVPWIPSLGIMPAKLGADRSNLSSKKTGKFTWSAFYV